MASVTQKKPHSREVPAIVWPTVFQEQYGFVHSVVRRMAGPDLDPEDLAQDVFVVVHRKIDSLRDPLRLRSWLFGICRRVVAQQRRKKKLRSMLRLTHSDPAQHHSTPEDRAGMTELERRLYAALEYLSARQRETLILFALQEMSGKEIAELLRIPEATVWTRLHAARQQLVRHFGTHGSADTMLREYLQ